MYSGMLQYMCKIFFQLHPFIYIQVTNVPLNGNTWRNITCRTINKHHLPKSHIFNKSKRKSLIMIIFAIHLLTSWAFNTHHFNLAFFFIIILALFRNHLSLYTLAMIIWVIKHFKKWYFNFFILFLLESALYAMSQYLHLSCILFSFSVISMKCF